MVNGDGEGFQVIAERTVPDVYSDSVSFELSVYGCTLEFGQAQKPPAAKPPAQPAKLPHLPRIRVHMSPQHAKVMAKVFVKNMKAYESQVGTIPIPEELLRELGVEEDW